MICQNETRREYDLRISTPTNIFVIGPSGCGKTTWVNTLIETSQCVLNPPPKFVVICYAENQPAYERIKRTCPVPIKFYKSFNMEIYDCLPRDTLLVLDDVLTDCKDKDLTEIIVRGGHHRGITQVLLGHNAYLKNMRTVSLNCHRFCFFKTIRDQTQIQKFGQQMAVGSKFLMNVYKHCTRLPHTYLFVDLDQETADELRFRSDIFNCELQPVYVHPDCSSSC